MSVKRIENCCCFIPGRLQRQNLFMAFSINNCQESAGTVTVIHLYLRYGM